MNDESYGSVLITVVLYTSGFKLIDIIDVTHVPIISVTYISITCIYYNIYMYIIIAIIYNSYILQSYMIIVTYKYDIQL